MTRRPGHDLRWLFYGLSGRLGRRAYAMLCAFWFCVTAIPVGMAVRVSEGGPAQAWVGLALIVVFGAGLVSLLTATGKRLHDLGWRAFWSFGLLLPGLSFVLVLALCLLPSQNSPNRYGPHPDAPGH